MSDLPVSEIARRLDALALQVCGALALRGERQGHELVALNPTRADRHLGSFRIELAGSRQGKWKDFACGGVGGDMLDLVGYVLGLDVAGRLRWAKDFLSIDDNAGSVPLPADDWQRSAAADAARASARKRNRALALYLEAQAALKGTPAYLYLLCRGIDLAALGRQPAALRYHPELYCAEVKVKLPAMVAAITGPDGKVFSLHRTWLRDTSSDGVVDVRKAALAAPKKTLGGFRGGCIRLWKGASGKAWKAAPRGDTLAITEGIEDGLTVAMIRPEWRVCAAVSVANMANVVLPDGVGTVVMAIDNLDGNPQAAAAVDKAVAKYLDQGRKVMIADPGTAKDFNALLTGVG